MRAVKDSSTFYRTTLLAMTSISAAAVLVAAAAVIVAPRTAQAKPEFTAQTKLACGKCHQAATGGGPVNAFGKAFKDNGNKLPK